MFDYKPNKTADGLSCDVEPRLHLAVLTFEYRKVAQYYRMRKA